MRRKVVGAGLVLALAVVGLVLTAAGSAKPDQSPLKIAWIYPGPHNDHGWSQAHEDGRLLVVKTFGDKVSTTYKENVFSNSSVPQIVAGLAREGYTMIFGCSFGNFSNGVNGQLYAKYPDIKFEEATGTQIKPNQAQYFGAGEDTIYLSGMAAGAASKKGLIGYIAAFGTPEIVRHINAFTLGAQATHPGAKVKLIWTNAWYSPPKETAAAQNLIAAGVDVIGQNVDSPAMNGTWKPGFYYGSIKDGFTNIAPFGPKVSAKTRAQIIAKKKAIVAGKFHVFQGPIYDQSGKLKVKPGQQLKLLKDLYTMQWLVRGVVGKVSSVLPPG
jgi:basic membrane protein A and related proteins